MKDKQHILTEFRKSIKIMLNLKPNAKNDLVENFLGKYNLGNIIKLNFYANFRKWTVLIKEEENEEATEFFKKKLTHELNI